MVSVLDGSLAPALNSMPPIVLLVVQCGDLDQGTSLADYNLSCGSPASQIQAQNAREILKHFLKGQPCEQRGRNFSAMGDAGGAIDFQG